MPTSCSPLPMLVTYPTEGQPLLHFRWALFLQSLSSELLKWLPECGFHSRGGQLCPGLTLTVGFTELSYTILPVHSYIVTSTARAWPCTGPGFGVATLTHRNGQDGK